MSGNNAPGFLALHGEKIAFGGIVAASVFFLYMGMGQDDYLGTQKPDALQQLAQTVKSSIDDDHWDNIKEDRLVSTNFGERVEKSQQPIPVGPYETTSPWEYRGKSSGTRRGDPEMSPPLQPHVVGVLASMAIDYKDPRTYPLSELEDAEPLEVKKKPKKKRNRRNRNTGNFYGSGGDGEDGGGLGSGGVGSGGTPMGPGGMGPGGSPMGPGGMGSGGMGPGGMSGNSDSTTRLVDKKYNLGFDASKIPKDVSEQIVPETGQFLAITALVEHRKLVEAYELAFLNAKGSNPARDRPTYWEFEVQRADVTDKAVDALTEDDWKLAFTFKDFEKQFKRWAGSSADITPSIYSDRQLTLPIPPVMLVDTTKFSLHPDLPLGDAILELEGSGTDTGNTDPADEDDDDDSPAGPPSFGGGPPGFGGGYPGGSGGYPGGEGGYGGMGEGGYGGMGEGGMPGMPGGGGMPGMGPGGGSGSGGMGGMGGYGGGMVSSASAPTYKQVRCYDFADPKNANAPKTGRRYVYRVRVAVEDPNFPLLPTRQPPKRYLSPEVYERIAAKEREAEAKDGKRDPRLWSDWSVPSEPAMLPSLERVFAGPVDPADVRRGRVGGQMIEFPSSPPKAEVVALKWDSRLGTDLIVPLEARPGGLLAKTDAANLIDPLTLNIRKLSSEALVNAESIVLDAFGGRELELDDDEEELTEPGYVLVFDVEGNLQVRSEIEDMDRYRMYSFADEREAAEAAAEEPDPADGGYPGGAGGPGGFPGGAGYPGGGEG
ncbi:hypothetical protein SH139x_003586 [Planctomycetaceae bacterium SH139]